MASNPRTRYVFVHTVSLMCKVYGRRQQHVSRLTPESVYNGHAGWPDIARGKILFSETAHHGRCHNWSPEMVGWRPSFKYMVCANKLQTTEAALKIKFLINKQKQTAFAGQGTCIVAQFL